MYAKGGSLLEIISCSIRSFRLPARWRGHVIGVDQCFDLPNIKRAFYHWAMDGDVATGRCGECNAPQIWNDFEFM